MTATVSLVMPLNSEKYTCCSGNSYTSSASGVVTGVVSGDVKDLLDQLGVEIAGAFKNALPWVTGRFYGLPEGATLAGVLTVASTIYAVPVFVPNAVTVSSLNVGVVTGQTGGLVRCALYADTGAGAPGALVAGTDSGSLDAASTEVSTKGSLAVSLAAGWYWAAVTAYATSTMPTITGATAIYASSLNASMGNDSTADALATSAKAATGVSAAFTYAAMPATFPSASYAQVLNATTPIVVIGV